ncbi:MAG: hypothetical protein ACU0DH_01485 [Paracoccus sp. (in: a-proteobacteria)]|uniref:hypothetical protein n=1 Tax=Paracoccus sp. TaxID=267 RepID=UPI002E85EB00|nr:hypothetical protein [Pseudomonadota bacterium]
MALKRVLLAAGLALAAGSAAADCADRIAFLDEVLLEAAEMSISTSSGGQGVAGARESQAVTEGEIIEPTAPYQDQPEEAEAIEEADEAGEGGNEILEARALLGEAQALEDDGDTAACEARLREVLVGLIRD